MDKNKEIILQDRYKVVSKLGRGGMGAVYLCVDLRLNCHVALKRMLSTEEFSSKRFHREASLLANLQHDNLPKVTDFFSERDEHFLVMEYIDGSDLQELLEKREKPFTSEEVDNWLGSLANVIHFLHGQQPPIIHRDIKPSNLKLTSRGKLFLLDFGLARGKAGIMKSQFSFSAPGFTPVFASLEQIQGEQATELSDIFSLGATLYCLLSKVRPPNALFRAGAIAKGEADPLLPLDRDGLGIPGNRADVILQCMSLNPAKRPQKIREFWNRWKIEKGAPIPDTKPSKPKWGKRAVFVIGAFVALLLLVALLSMKGNVGGGGASTGDEMVTFNYKTRVYHCPSCEWAVRCTRSCRVVKLSEAIKAGGHPCRTCKGTCR